MTSLPSFRPHPLIRGGHAQTLVGAYWPSGQLGDSPTRTHTLPLPDGDALALHDDEPPGWPDGGPAALLLHGLAGCHASGYLIRLTRKLRDRGWRVFRLDHRGCGAGVTLARLPYHAGRSEDLRAVIDWLAERLPGSRLAVAGFSLSGNIVLKYLAEAAQQGARRVARAAAICPPIDLARCVDTLRQTRLGRQYDVYFARRLCRQLAAQRRVRPDLPAVADGWQPRSLRQFDDEYTAPHSGYASADDYYARASSAPLLPNVTTPTLILAAEDDPLVDAGPFADVELPPAATLRLLPDGGHLGFLAPRSADTPDRRWMDTLLLHWLTDG